MSAGQWDRSLSTSMEWLSKEPENVRAHRVAAQSLINLDRTGEAGKHLEKVLTGNPNDDFAHRLMAMVQFREGKFRLADESIHKAISLDPTDAYNWHQLAHMSYRQGDLATARKSIARARELNPRNADILNLAILCEPKGNGPDAAGQKIQQFKEALELDPENANLYNNMGTQYLDQLKDYPKAEECFRRGLSLEPKSKTIRKNLLVTVKKRDVVYRTLCAPRDWLYEAINFFRRQRQRGVLVYLLMIPLWLLAVRYILAGLILWFALVWPLMRVYEYLTIGDIRARAGELGVRRGGFLGYRQWPVKARLSIFALFLVLFWGGIAWISVDAYQKGNEESAPLSLGLVLFGLVVFFGAIGFLVYIVRSKIKKGSEARAARRRARKMESFFSPKSEG